MRESEYVYCPRCGCPWEDGVFEDISDDEDGLFLTADLFDKENEISKDFSPYSASTLDEDDIGTHEDGWTISGDIHEDYYKWVNEFEANHPIYGKVWGDFECTVYATSESGYQHFIQHHPPQDWDYGDI